MKRMFMVLVFISAILGSAFSQAAEKGMDRTTLPIKSPEFKGKITETFENSKQDYPQPVKAPKGAPNVVLILIDDLGFGQPGTFGGPVPTPVLDHLASQGLRYNTFHTTAICSPTRAALLTGRNHHQVATGTITELSTGFPGYHSIWPKETVSIAEILKDNGYTRGPGENGTTHPIGKPAPSAPLSTGPQVWDLSIFMDSWGVKPASGNSNSSETQRWWSRRKSPRRDIT